MTVEVLQISGPALMLLLPAMPEDERHIMNSWLNFSQHLWVGIVDGALACAWGLVPPTLLSDSAHLWLYTTPAVDAHRFLLVRKSQLVVQGMLQLYPRITGYTLIENASAQRWIEWLGGAYGQPEGKFLPFEIRSKGWLTQSPSAHSA